MNVADVAEYIIALVNEFAKRFDLTDPQAFRYLKRYGAIKVFIEHYNVVHTQSFEDMVEAAAEYCRSNGGKLG